MDSLQKGRTFATKRTLVEFTMGGHSVGDELKLDRAQDVVSFTAKLRSIVPWIIWSSFAMDAWCNRFCWMDRKIPPT